MTENRRKVAYITSQRQTRGHECHWPECKTQVPPAMWGCKKHWFTLPKSLRDKVWAVYNIGQEIDRTVSKEYAEVAEEVQKWIREYQPQ